MQLSEHLTILPDAHRAVASSCLLARRDDVVGALKNAVAGISQARLKDFDWNLKVVSLQHRGGSFFPSETFS